ncbi:MAG: hypothetical protein LC119_11880, partial [Burkholderiales bacterium]|nr:hypothetical protein [Burkholderiales bacterium]
MTRNRPAAGHAAGQAQGHLAADHPAPWADRRAAHRTFVAQGRKEQRPGIDQAVVVIGGPCRIRTYDQRIKSPLL